MSTIKILLLLFYFNIGISVIAQNTETLPDLSKVKDSNSWILSNREIKIEKDGVIHLNGKQGDGLLWIKEPIITNGRIECDIKGQVIQGKSFVGIAFHGLNDSTYDAVYFRPFNFKSPDRNAHSVQYISHPEFTWHKLREDNPGKYENSLNIVPNPNDWFHVTILIDYPKVEVFVNNSENPSLKIKQLSSRKKGWIGFWVGNNSEGYFKNFKIISNY